MSRVLSLVVVVLLSACGSPSLGNFDSMGFVHERYPYTVDYRDPAKQEFINADWQLDNFYVKAGKLTPKGGTEYELVTSMDTDGDGNYERKEKGYAYDIRLEHAKREQTVWLRTLPIDKDDERKNLDVLMRDYVAAVAGSGYAVVSLTGKTVTITERRFATEMVGQKSIMVAGREGLLVVFDVANVDQLSVNHEDRTKRVALLFVRSGFKHVIERKPKPVEFPVIMVAGYASHPSDFDKGVSAFEYFVSRVMLRSAQRRGKVTDEELRGARALPINLNSGSVATLVRSANPAPTPAPAPAAMPEPATTPTTTAPPTTPEPAPPTTPSVAPAAPPTS